MAYTKAKKASKMALSAPYYNKRTYKNNNRLIPLNQLPKLNLLTLNIQHLNLAHFGEECGRGNVVVHCDFSFRHFGFEGPGGVVSLIRRSEIEWVSAVA